MHEQLAQMMNVYNATLEANNEVKRLLRDKLLREFPLGSIVLHGNNTTIRVSDCNVTVGCIELRFENGNVWWKPYTECTSVVYRDLDDQAKRIARRIRGMQRRKPKRI